MANNKQMMEAILFEQKKRKASGSLYEFVKQSWHVVEPGIPFIESWHIERICEHLEAVSAGDIKRLLINIPPRHALKTNTIIPTITGKKTIADLIVGDYVFGANGNPIAVTGKSDIFNNQQIYRVWTDDKSFIDVDGEHLWTVRLERKHKAIKDYTTEQLWLRQNGAFLRTKRGGGVDIRLDRKCKDIRLPRLPDVLPAQYPKKSFLIDPYILGLWLGDGTSANGYMTLHDDDAAIIRPEIEKRGFEIVSNKAKYRFNIKGLMPHLRSIGVLNNKHIPKNYLEGSIKQRRDLLKGLMDTDGNVSLKGQCFFAQSNYKFILQVAELLRSLGIKASIIESEAKLNGKSFGPAWKVSFYASNIAFLPRKEDRTLKNDRHFGRYIKIEKLSEFADTQCISVDSEDGLFLAGDGYIVTHNSKSTIVSVMWPAWEWLTSPEEKFLCASYSGSLSIRDNLKTRRLIQSPWYQARWSHMFKFSGDQNAKQRFENDKTGYRIATSVGGTATGEGGSRLLLDDPHSAQAAQSDVIRGSDLDWFDQVWSTRLNNPKKDAMVTVMQRLHERDISGHILEDIGGWEHICIPAEWDGEKRKTSLGVYDDRETIGELICPERFGAKEIQNLKKLLGQYGSAGQLQQTPSPAEGGILKTKYFNLWPAAKGLPQFEFVLQSYDCAFTEKSTGDPTACSVWAVFTYQNARQVMLIDAWDDHLSYPELRKRAINDWTTEYGGMSKDSPFSRARRPDCILVEAKASGQSLIQDLRLARVPVVGYNPGNADKVSRAHQSAPTLEAGLLWIPESTKNIGHSVTWAQRFIKQLDKFPVADHDDYVDTFSQAIIYLKNDGWLDLQQAKDVDGPRLKKKEHTNPYAA